MARVKEVTQPVMLEWFEQLKSVINEFDIVPENMYNMDETGFSIGTIQKAFVVINKTEQSQSVVHPGRQEWTTIIECISADGGVLPPFLILKGKYVSQAWIPKSILDEEWKLGASESGWTSNELGYIWLSEIFEPATREKAGERKRLLICDGHESHVSPKFVSFCIDHNIELVLLVPHSSHLTQPLDVGVFGPLKSAVSRALDRLLRLGITRLEKVEFVEQYMKGRADAFTSRNIKGGWRGSGLFPLSASKILWCLPDSNSQSKSESTDNKPLTPTNTTSTSFILSALQATPTSFDIQQFTKQLANLAVTEAINSPWKKALFKIKEATEQTVTENIILKQQLAGAEGQLVIRKERKTGKRVVLKGVAHVSSKQMLDLLTECAEEAKSKKRILAKENKRKETAGIESVTSELEDNVKET